MIRPGPPQLAASPRSFRSSANQLADPVQILLLRCDGMIQMPDQAFGTGLSYPSVGTVLFEPFAIPFGLRSELIRRPLAPDGVKQSSPVRPVRPASALGDRVTSAQAPGPPRKSSQDAARAVQVDHFIACSSACRYGVLSSDPAKIRSGAAGNVACANAKPGLSLVFASTDCVHRPRQS